MANAVNVLHTIAEVEKYRDASFPNPVKRLMTGRLIISTKIIKRMVNNCPFYKNSGPVEKCFVFRALIIS